MTQSGRGTATSSVLEVSLITVQFLLVKYLHIGEIHEGQGPWCSQREGKGRKQWVHGVQWHTVYSGRGPWKHLGAQESPEWVSGAWGVDRTVISLARGFLLTWGFWAHR